MDIILNRNNNNDIKVNIEHKIRRHSNTFDWGTLNEGALDLSLNILNKFCDELTRERLYKKFATDIIADIPYGGAVLKENDIQSWIFSNIHFNIESKLDTYIVAVYKEETSENVLHFIPASNEIEAIITACESKFETERIKALTNEYLNDYNGITEYYQSKGVYFSDPVINIPLEKKDG
ncbi:DUF6166 domain-containing protein [Calidifontibacillus erzurumensis]|uniref:DUF6166 domain-containing protein n=1 Tax=Calidifontibacillus erzurumensis TaxID=2741433 RepID=UPI0035B528AB